jgi:creatinine amidohydrolase
MVWHIADLVREGELEAARDGGLVDIEADGEARNGTRIHYDAIDVSDNGAFGDPTDASAEKGARLFEAATEQLVELAEWATLAPSEHVRERESGKR